ncbi:MAG: hypothetical protein HC828_02645 [Blastochloris sp.]|nr:hypothetical protein [Blastochloris sp.]
MGSAGLALLVAIILAACAGGEPAPDATAVRRMAIWCCGIVPNWAGFPSERS